MREISLKNRPQALYDISKKGTVPVLCINKHNVIDEIVYVKCDKSLYNQNMTLLYPTFFGNVNLEYSKCPLYLA